MTWLKAEIQKNVKFFEYINERNPPFRNSTLKGADIDVSIYLSIFPIVVFVSLLHGEKSKRKQ